MSSQGPERSSGRGLFLSLDGPDGGGKTTQVEHLARWLERLGWEVTRCRDPGGTPLGERLRALLQEDHDTPIGMRAEMLLFMASRAQLVDQVIRPALEAGKAVVCDRFLLANVVYQGHAGGLPVDALWAVGRAATGGLLPDLTIVIDVPLEVAQTRLDRPRDRIEQRPEDYRQAVRRGFLHEAESFPGRIALIDGAADEETVARQIQHEVTRVVGQDPRA